MSPQIVPLYSFPGCVAARRTLKQVLLSASVPAAAIALLSGCLVNPAFAATHTNSLLVSATVEAGCQVSPTPSTAGHAAAAANSWNAPISVNCSLPVDFQVNVSSGTPVELAQLDLTDAASLAGYAGNGGLDSLPAANRTVSQTMSQTMNPAMNLARVQSPERASTPEIGMAGLASSGAPADFPVTEDSPDGSQNGTITVTIVY